MGIVVVGDIHYQEKMPKKAQAEQVIDFIFNNKEYNNSNNVLFLLGDLVENVESPHEVLGYFVNLFLNRAEFEWVYILQGNHDACITSSLLSVFKPIQNITIIQEPTIVNIHNKKILALPYYYHEGTSLPPMIENYSSILKDLYSNQSFDLVFHHVEDETEHYGKKFCDLSWVNTKDWLCGHIHTCSLQKGGRYLGACTLNSSTEKGRQPYIAYVTDAPGYKLIPVPKILDYYTVDYPNELPDITTPYALWMVTNSIDKEETIAYYTKKAKEKGQDFFYRKIMQKAFEKFERSSIIKHEKTSLIDEFEIYSNKLNLSDEVSTICKSLIAKKFSS